jgi:hypothetical protein
MNTKVLKLKRLVEDLEIELDKDYPYIDHIVESIIEEADKFIKD